MDESTFWKLVDQTRPAKSSQPQHLAAIRRRLRELTADEIASFQRHLDAAMAQAQDRNLWAAAILIRGLCNDDGFIYFCLWLISRGRAIYEAALKDPDTLADVVKRGGTRACRFEELWSVATSVYQEVAEQEMPKNDVAWPSEPRGEWGDMDDAAMKQRFPRLSARFADG